MLIAMATFDTVENKRTVMTERTLQSLAERVDWKRHRLVISDNGSCEETRNLYTRFQSGFPFEVIFNGDNLGTARAINRAWSLRKPGEHLVKMDNDVVVNHTGWADEVEDVFRRDPTIGICGLKRKDLEQCPFSPQLHYKTILKMLPHNPGESWIVVEESKDIMGTCTAFNSVMMDRFGGLYQMQDEGNLYGYDDNLACVRTQVLGLKTVFIPHINIDHIDHGGTVHTKEKTDNAGKWMNRFNQVREEYRTGQRSPYWKDSECH